MLDFEFAKDKVLMGSERRSMVINNEEKRITAIHEAGHALLAVLLPNADPIHKVTIVPRGMALGLTQQLPIDEKHNHSEPYLKDTLVILLGGRFAEELLNNGIKTTGASNDLERATDLARKMVCEWGMSEMGPITYGKREEQIFLGREIAQHQDYSEATAVRIDEEVKQIIIKAQEQAKTLLIQNLNSLKHISDELLIKETLTGEEVKKIIQPKEV